MKPIIRDKINRTKRNTGLLLSLIVLILASTTFTLSETPQQKLLYLSVEKPYYEVGEKIILIITAEPINDYELSISSPNSLYKYSGELKSLIEFYPKEPGLHAIEFTSKQTMIVVDSLQFMVGALAETSSLDNLNQESSINPGSSINPESSNSEITQPSNTFISTNKQNYAIGEQVTASVVIPNQENYKLYYEYNGFVQRYMGDFAEIKFMPRGIGTHYLVLKDLDNNEVERHSFEVTEGKIPEITQETTSEPAPIEAEPLPSQGNEKASLKALKGQFKQKEDAVFEFDFDNNELLLGNPKQKGTWNGPGQKITAELLDNKNEKQEVLPEIEQLADGSFIITVPRARAIRPGAYELRVELTTSTETIVEQQGFLWGVLAINIHKSIYLPGEQAFIGMAVLDDSGHMVCDANVTLEIVAPSDNSTILSTSDHTIIVSPQCTFYGVTELPDYYTYYTVGGVGNYTMRLNAITSEGIRNLTDAFVVQESVEFDVERQGPTRTYPEVPYTMSFVIKANKNYTGVIKEFVPESFEITPQPGLTATTINDTNNNTNNDAQELSWQVKMVQGQTYSYGYEFDAPSTSPLLLTLGALEIGTWKEAREWLIANDGTLIDNNNTVNDTRIIEGETIRVDTQYDSYKNDVYHIQLNHSGTKILDDVCTGGAKFYIASVNTTNCAADSDSCTWDSANDYVILVTSATISQRNSHIYWDIMSCGGSADNYTFVCGEGSGSTDPVTCDNLSAIVIVTSLGDSTAPSININSALNNTYKTSTPTIDFNFTDSQSSSANCTLYFNNTAYNRTNNISNNTQANLKVNTSLTGGTYSVYINCTDQSNNIGKSSVINILVDTTPPNTTLDSPANGTNITTSTYTVNATAADAGSGVSTVIFEYRENASESWKSACTDTTPDGSSYSCTWSLSGLSEQSTYQVRARVNDSVGNYGNNDTHTGIGVFRVPDIENVSASPQRVGVGQQVTISADIYDANGISRAWIILTRPDNVNVTSDMTYTSGNTYRFNYTPFITGTYKYTIKANDTQGNLEVLDPYFFVYVDTTVHVMPENESYTNGQDVKLIPGYVNWSTDQESGTQQIKAQGQRITSFTAVGGSIIAGSAGYDTTDGSYSDTTTNNSVYYAVGRDNGPGIGSAESLQAYINLTYNISSIGVSLSSINNIIFGINFCHTNDVTAPITCGSPIDGTANNPVNFDLFNYDANGWETKSTFNQNSSSATEQTINFSVSTTLSKYLSSYYVQARYETDVTLVAYEDAAFAMDYAPIYVNYTKLDNEGSYDYVNYTNIDGTNLTQLKAFDVVITVPYYNGSGSVQAGNKLPDLEVTVYTGSSYTSAGACELNKSLANISSSAFNCTVTVSDTSIINAWKNNTANRRVQIRGIYFDEENGQADAINYTDVRIKYFSGSLIPNHGNYSLSGYLLMRVLKNDSGSYAHIATVVNDTNTSTIRNISAYDILDIGSIWNATSFNTEYYNPGIYTINVSFTDDNGSVIRDDNGISLTGYANFILDYIKINITSPPNNSIQDSEGFDANITLSYYNYASGGMCYDSIDGGSNITMQAINSTFYHNTTTTVSLGTHNITFYCNDTRGYWFASGVHYFNATDQRGPVVNLESPANDSEEPGGDVTFYYNVTDSMSGVQNCTLILDYTNRVNTSYNVTENTTLNFTVTGLSYENHVWQIECYDNSTSNNKGLSSVYKFLIGNDTEPPDVTLLDPEPSYNTTTPDLVFSYTVVDTLSGIANCSLIINGSVNQTNSTILTGETAVNYFRQYFEIGSYNWSVNCTDIRNNEGASESRIFTVFNDTDYPVVKLISPDDDYVDTDGDIIFMYNVTDASSSIVNCSLILNGSINQTNSSITEGATQYFYLYGLADSSNWLWSVNCTDTSANRNINGSETRNLTINIVSNMLVTVTSNKGEYQTGEIAQINTTVKDTLGSNLAADVLTDIIQGNATVTWWDTSWQRRKPIILSSSTNLTDALVEVNITGLSGNISSCQNEIRIIRTESDNSFSSINRTIVGGDNSNYCVVRFKANITSSINNTNHYAYYNNSGASNPENNITRVNLTSVRTAESGSLISGSGGYNVNSGSSSDTTSDNGVYYAVGRDNAGGSSNALQAYINLSYNISGTAITEENILSFNFTINYCHTDDVTDPITCGSDAVGTAQNPVNTELYGFNDTAWQLIGTFSQNDASSAEQNSSFPYSTTLDIYVDDNGRIWVRYETDFTHGNNQDSSFALDYATLSIGYKEKIYTNLSSIGNTQKWVARQAEQGISAGKSSFNFSTANYSAGAHSAVSRANLTGYSTTFNHTFFNVILDVFGPIIKLESPPDDEYSINNNITFAYNVTDVGHDVINCSLIINNAWNQSNNTITEGMTQYFYLYGLADGQYNWSINCTDTLGYVNKSETRNLTIGADLIGPEITIYKPSNNTPFLTGSTIVFNYTANDALNGLANCSLIINGSIFNTTDNPAESTVLNFTVSSLGDGNYTWNINCTDDSSNHNVQASETRAFSIGPDTSSPDITLKSPINGGQADTENVTLTYNVTDFLSSISNCTIRVYNSSMSLVYNYTNDSVQETVNQYFYAYYLGNGLHYWNVSCWDNASTPNEGFSATWNFTINSDTSLPVVHLLSPPTGYQDVDSNVTFYFNVSEDITSIANCSLIFNGSVNTTKNGSEITNNAINNFTLYNMGTANYLWRVNCSDTALLGSNIGSSPELWTLIVAPDTVGPVVTLFNPPDDVQDTDGTVTFEFNASDYASNITNCSFVFNNTINYTWNSVNESQHYSHTMYEIPNGNYTWYVNCTDDSISYNIGKSEIRNLSIGVDVTPPNITLISPPDNTKDSDGNITFTYNVSDYASNITNCSLIINGSINQTNYTITESVEQYFYLYNLNDTQFHWSINCTDDSPSPNTGASETRNISVLHPKPLITDIMTDNTTYVQGRTVQVTANTTNASGSLIDTGIAIDIVRGNGKAPWWGTSWKYRIPLELDTGAYNREYTLVEQGINFTEVLANQINITDKSLDTNSIRVVEWEADNDSVEIPSIFSQASGFNASTNAAGTVSWIIEGDVAANTIRNYYIYFDTTDNPKSAPNYEEPTYAFVGSGKSISYDGSSSNADYMLISSEGGDDSLAIQFSDGDSLPNQQHIKMQGAGAIWNISVNNNLLTNQNSSIVPLSVAVNDSFTAASTSNISSGPITRISIPGGINTDPSSTANLNYLVWFGDSEIFIRANFTADFASSENNNYAFENTWFSYLFDDDNNTGWTNYINKMMSQSRNQTHDYHGVQENTFNTFYAGDWYMEYASSLGAIGFVAEKFTVNSANATKGVVTFDDDNDGEEADMVGFSNNGNPDITAGDTYNLVVWIILTPQANSTRISSFRSQVLNSVNISQGSGEEFITRSSGTTSNGFYYYNFSTSGQRTGNYSAISWAYQTDFVNASAYTWFNITRDTIPPTVTLVRPEGWLNYDDINFTFYIEEGGSGIYNCSLYINGLFNYSKNGGQLTDFANNTFNLSNMPEGSYNWTVLCYDNGSNNGTDDAFNISIDTTPPNVTINSPEPNAMLNDQTPLFNFTITDNLADPINYTIYVNGAPNGQSGTAGNSTPTEVNLSTLSDGIYNITIKGTDYAGNSANATVQITIDAQAPVVNFETGNGTWFNDSTPPISFNISDAVDTNINYTVYVNGSFDQSGNTPRNTSTTINLSSYSDGRYNITITATDDANNSASYSIIIYIDTQKPGVVLTYPDNSANFTVRSVSLNFTATDNLDSSLTCNLTLDGIANRTSFEAQSGQETATLISGLAEATHYWNVTCWDNATNTNTSETRSFNIFIAPTVNLTAPANGNLTNNPNQTFYFNVSDETGIYNCSLILNGAINTTKQGSQITNNATNNFTINNLDGIYNWSVRCYDNSSLNTEGNSETWIIYVDVRAPIINLSYPENNANFTTRTVSLNFTPTDNQANPITCNLTLDSLLLINNTLVNNGSRYNLTVYNLSEGAHYWNVTCWDNATNTNTSETRSFNIFIAPTVNLTAPANGNLTNNPNQTFYFNVSDETGIYNCSLILNGAINTTKQGSQITNNATNNFTLYNMGEGNYTWSVRCYDNTSLYMQSDSENWTITIDLTPPYPSITTPNYSWFNTSSPNITFIITDNLDLTINYTFYVNGSANISGASNNNTPSSTNLQDLNSNSSFVIVLQAADDAGNSANSSSIIIYVDTEKPSINLSAPVPGYEFNTTTVQFNFTATDNMANYLMCNLTISNGMYEYNINASNGVLQNITKSGFSSGTYYWNVSCIDIAGNRNTSETRNFTILAPDLIITRDNIEFNETSPEEGQNITIYANIYNTGGSPAYNVTVQFWKGDPDSGGTQINGNRTISTLTNGNNITVNITYTTIISDNNIFVVVDPPTATNGTIIEENESNNKANKSFSVGLYQVYAGNTSGLIDLEKQSINISVFQWSISNATGSNIFVTDLEANPDFNNLQAVSRDTSNASTTNDFEEIDIALGSTSYSDSVNNTFTSNGSPKETRSFTVFTQALNNVPVINSTNTTNFKTGILWDKSDGNTEYNGTQDIIFITEINEQQQGSQGIYDFEIKVPALLRNYNAAGTSVAFYVELK